jgi:hypothetical protein
MVDQGMKLVHKISERRWELFDLKSDPRQQKNVAENPAYRQKLDSLRSKLVAFEERRR